jgi:tight adherence protein B
LSPAVLLAALAGGLAAVAAREALRATPAAAAWLARAVEPLSRAGSEGYAPSVAERRRLGLVMGAAFLGGGTWLFGPAPAAPLAAAGPAAATWAVSARANRYRGAVERALPRVAVATADALAAGRSVRSALEASAGALDGPAAAEMARVRADLDLGLSLEAALGGLRSRMGSARVDSFCSALLSQRITGGDLVGLLRRYAQAAAGRERIEADARSATAQARFTGILVAAMPAGAALLAELLNPGFVTEMVHNGVSLALLAVSVLLQVAGFFAISHLGKVMRTA